MPWIYITVRMNKRNPDFENVMQECHASKILLFSTLILMADPTDSAQVVSGTQLRSELAQIALETVACGAHTVTFQPRTQYRIEDRHLVEDWILSNRIWKFIGIFDGSRLSLV